MYYFGDTSFKTYLYLYTSTEIRALYFSTHTMPPHYDQRVYTHTNTQARICSIFSYIACGHSFINLFKTLLYFLSLFISRDQLM